MRGRERRSHLFPIQGGMSATSTRIIDSPRWRRMIARGRSSADARWQRRFCTSAALTSRPRRRGFCRTLCKLNTKAVIKIVSLILVVMGLALAGKATGSDGITLLWNRSAYLLVGYLCLYVAFVCCFCMFCFRVARRLRFPRALGRTSSGSRRMGCRSNEDTHPAATRRPEAAL